MGGPFGYRYRSVGRVSDFVMFLSARDRNGERFAAEVFAVAAKQSTVPTSLSLRPKVIVRTTNAHGRQRLPPACSARVPVRTEGLAVGFAHVVAGALRISPNVRLADNDGLL